MSIEPWNTGTAAGGEDMPRKSIDIRLTDDPVKQKRGLLRPFPASGEDGSGQSPGNGSRDWSLVGFGATPQGLKSPLSAIFKVRLSLIFRLSFFIDYLTLPHFALSKKTGVIAFSC